MNLGRDPDTLLESALKVIDLAFRETGTWKMCPLFSGGHDSYSACYVASQHRKFQGNVYHIDTGIGSKQTRRFVEEVCKEQGWELVVLKSKATYERFVSRLGFPGPGAHSWVYHWIKDRCVSQLTRSPSSKRLRMKLKTMLVTGCRSEESVRRMGYVVPFREGELNKRTGKTSKLERVWVSPCHDWREDEQRAFMNAFSLSRNPVKDSLLGMSGECFCGAFARPYELQMIREICPDVAEEIDRLTKIAKANGTPHEWGVRPGRGEMVLETGPLCNRCDIKARQAGLIIKRQDGPVMVDDATAVSPKEENS
jgi:3'-phosphoadenosine 5'-phosphosulfate sulfotransferase (PAPS reductase)/FAD synthetase